MRRKANYESNDNIGVQMRCIRELMTHCTAISDGRLESITNLILFTIDVLLNPTQGAWRAFVYVGRHVNTKKRGGVNGSVQCFSSSLFANPRL